MKAVSMAVKKEYERECRKMNISKEQIQDYVQKVHEEMRKRGYTEEEIPKIIGRTGFMPVIEEFPEEQFCYTIEAAVDEILEIGVCQVKCVSSFLHLFPQLSAV